MRLQLFIWSTIINALISFSMVLLVLFSKPLTKVKATWSAMCFSIGIWSLGLGWMSFTKDFSVALLGSTVVTGASIFIPTFLYHTVHVLLKRTSNWPLAFMYAVSFFLSLLNFQGKLMTVEPALDFPFYTFHKPAYTLFMLHLYGGFAIVEFVLWRSAQKAPPLIKKQLSSLFWGAGLGFLGGQMTVPLVYGFPVFPYGVFFVPIYIISVGYGMLKYQLMDFQLAIRKMGLTIAIYALLLIIIAPVGWPLIQSIRSQPPLVFQQIMAFSVLFTILLAAGPVIYALVLHRTYWLRGHKTMALTHELKSPLATIRGSIEYLEKKIANIPDNDALIDYTQILNRSADRMENLVRNLLNIAAIQEGEITLDFKEFSLHHLAQSVVEYFTPMANQKGIKIYLFPCQNSQIFGDQEKIEQVLSNLISNAIKYSKEGIIEIKIEKKAGEMFCSVSDGGIGIDARDLSRVFDRFFQGSKTSKGTGIGLAIAKAWINAHRGKIWAESERGKKGTTVVFILPR